MADTPEEKQAKQEVAATEAAAKKTAGVVEVPVAVLAEMQEQMSRMEKDAAERDAKIAGLEEMQSAIANPEAIGAKPLREKKTFEPKFRMLRLRKYPIAGKLDDMGIVIGWTSRGAYREIDVNGLTREWVDFIDVIFLGHEKNEKGQIKAEKVKLLDLVNNGVQEWYKILETKVEQRPEPTNEEIDVTIFDPAHGLVSTGDKVDGYTMFTDRTYKVLIPGVGEVWVDSEFANK